MTICYQIMPNLPPVPDQFIEQALARAETLDGSEQSQHHSGRGLDYRREVLRHNRVEIVRNNIRVAIGPEIESWVAENISRKALGVGVASSIGDSDLQSPHTDGTRNFALIYVIELSNEDQDTVFWQEPGRSLHRRRLTNSYELDQLVEIDRVRIPLRC
jgi:hypothetical protein